MKNLVKGQNKRNINQLINAKYFMQNILNGEYPKMYFQYYKQWQFKNMMEVSDQVTQIHFFHSTNLPFSVHSIHRKYFKY